MFDFLLPKTLCDEMTSIIRQFWWSTEKRNREICWKRWDDLCKSKCEGVLGFHDSEVFNFALLAK